MTTTPLDRIRDELDAARVAYPLNRSAAHALGVLREEIKEFGALVMVKQSHHDYARMIEELIQVGAMALRHLEDHPASAYPQWPMHRPDTPHAIWQCLEEAIQWGDPKRALWAAIAGIEVLEEGADVE